MKKLENLLGVHQFSLFDLDVIQAGSFETISSLAYVLSNGQPCILNGCEVTKIGNNYTWSAGAIYFNNEIFQVAASTAALVSTGVPMWKVVPKNIKPTVSGNKMIIALGDLLIKHLNGGNFQIHKDYQVTLSASVATGETLVANYNETRRVEWLMRNKLNLIGTIIQMNILSSDFNLDSNNNPTTGKAYTQHEGWRAYASGKVLVGLDKLQTEFDTLSETGGVKSNKLVESDIPQMDVDITDPGHTHDAKHGRALVGIGSDGNYRWQDGDDQNKPTELKTTDITAKVGTPIGTQTSLNNLQPYQVVLHLERYNP